MKRNKPSSALVFTSVCVSITILSIFIVSAVSLRNLRRLSQENILHIRDSLASTQDQYMELLQASAAGNVSEVVKSTELVFAASRQAGENGKGLDALDAAIQRFTVRRGDV